MYRTVTNNRIVWAAAIVPLLLRLNSSSALLLVPTGSRHFGGGAARRTAWHSNVKSSKHPVTLSASYEEASQNDEALHDDGVLLSDDSEPMEALPPGVADGFFVVKQYATPLQFDIAPQFDDISDRLGLSHDNITLPVALMLLDAEEYPSFSKARKAIRKGRIVIHRGGGGEQEENALFNSTRLSRGRVGDRVYPGDILGKQVRLSHGAYSEFLSYDNKPSFDLPVVYEDDHIAVVNKPAGVMVYGEGNKGRNNVKYALPYILAPPAVDTEERLDRPSMCHRLDKPTCGLLIVAKTMPALVKVSKQFEERVVQKTYTAILNGKLEQPDSETISSLEAFEMGVDVDPSSNVRWHVAQGMQDDKMATTVWRVLRYQRSVKAEGRMLTVVELKPKTGRFHQLRRHMAEVYNCPILGDTTYGEMFDHKRWGRGLMLCSNRVVFTHPYYSQKDLDVRESSSMLEAAKGDDTTVFVHASIDLPPKFDKLLASEEKRFQYEGQAPLDSEVKS